MGPSDTVLIVCGGHSTSCYMGLEGGGGGGGGGY